MPYISCIVASCNTQRNNHTRKNEVIKCFSLPKDPVLRQKWLALCRVETLDTVKDAYRRVCIRHFKEGDFVDGLKARLLNLQPTRLKKDAVPSLLLTHEEEEDKLKEIDIQTQVDLLIGHKLKDDSGKPTEIKKHNCKQNTSSTEYLSKLVPIAPKGVVVDVIKPGIDPLKLTKQDKQNTLLKKESDNHQKSVLKPVVKHHISEHHVKVLIHDNAIYKKRIKELIHNNAQLKCRVKELESKIQNEERNFTKKVKNHLSHLFTPHQIDIVLRKKTKPSWTEDDYTRAYTLQRLSKKAYFYVKETLNYPLPAFSTLRGWVMGLGKDKKSRNKVAIPILNTVRQNVLQVEKRCNEFENRIEFITENVSVPEVMDGKDNIDTVEDIVLKQEMDLYDDDNDKLNTDDNEKYEPTKYEYLVEHIKNDCRYPNNIVSYENQSSDSYKCSNECDKSSDEIYKCSDEDNKSSEEMHFKNEQDQEMEGEEYFEELIIDNFSDNETEMVYSEENQRNIIEEENG